MQGGRRVRLGVMTKVYPRESIEAVAAAIAADSLTTVQFNFESAGLDSLPEVVDPALCRRIREAFTARGIEISAVSGTFNAIHPDVEYRRECIRRVGSIAAHCADLGTRVITLCTGTRNPESMWRHHPDNSTPEAWDEMRATMRQLVALAEPHGVTLAFEPEVVNVIDTAEKAERLILEVGSPYLRVVMDPANYFHAHMLPHMHEVLEDAFARVGRHIALAHAKDVRLPYPGDDECVRPAAGTGVLDYSLYLRLLRASGYNGGLIMHSLDETEVPASRDFVRRHLDAAA